MSTIYINGRFMTKQITGEQRYAFELIKAMDMLLCRLEDNMNEWKLIVPGKILPQYKTYSFSRIKLQEGSMFRGHLWEQIELPWITGGNLLLNFCDMAPILKRNQMVTIHDMILKTYPENYSKMFRWWHLLVFNFLSCNTKQFFTVSQFSKKELCHHLGISPDKIAVIQPASFEGERHSVMAEHMPKNMQKILSGKYVLAIGSMSGHKNFARLAHAMQLIDDAGIKLVVAGMSNCNIFANAVQERADNIVYTGYVSDSELAYLYKHASCFVLPSLYEGFGIPPIEAMRYGCPVAVSDIEVMHEVCGNAAIYFDPLDVEDIAAKILLLLKDSRLRENLINSGYKQSGKFKWEKSAGKVLKFAARFNQGK